MPTQRERMDAMGWLKRRRRFVALALCISVSASASAQGATDPDDALKDDIVAAYRILVNEGILDSFGHVTARSNKDPNIFLMPQAMPPQAPHSPCSGHTPSTSSIRQLY